jgi:hypothetical protein
MSKNERIIKVKKTQNFIREHYLITVYFFKAPQQLIVKYRSFLLVDLILLKIKDFKKSSTNRMKTGWIYFCKYALILGKL